MPQRRKPEMQHIPAYEDAGLFKNTVAPFSVELVPQTHRNTRQDLVVRGFLNDHEISVMFAGRRAKQVVPLEARLSSMILQARRYANGTHKPLELDHLRLPLWVEGAWRSSFLRDASGWETRTYQLMVARWRLPDARGTFEYFGAAPVLPGKIHLKSAL